MTQYRSTVIKIMFISYNFQFYLQMSLRGVDFIITIIFVAVVCGAVGLCWIILTGISNILATPLKS